MIASGRVQGVGYRYFVQMKASIYGIGGWVRNCDNGDVELVAVGKKEDLQLFIDAIREGNPFSRVNDLKIQEFETTEAFSSFKIRY